MSLIINKGRNDSYYQIIGCHDGKECKVHKPKSKKDINVIKSKKDNARIQGLEQDVAVTVAISKEGNKKAEKDALVQNNNRISNSGVSATDIHEFIPTLSDRNASYIEDAMRIYDPQAFNEMVDRTSRVSGYERDLEQFRCIAEWYPKHYQLYDRYHKARFGASRNMVTDLSYKVPLYNTHKFAYNSKMNDFGNQLKGCLMFEDKYNVFMSSNELISYLEDSDKIYNKNITKQLLDANEKIKEYDEKGVEHGNIGFLIEGASIKEVYALNGDKIIRGTDIDDLFSNLSKTE